MRMLSGRRPRRPDDNFYRESRRNSVGGRGRQRLGVVTLLVLIGIVVATIAWWLLRGNP